MVVPRGAGEIHFHRGRIPPIKLPSNGLQARLCGKIPAQDYEIL